MVQLQRKFAIMKAQRPTVAVAGLACETSSFTRSRTLAPAFHPLRGDEIQGKYPFINSGTPIGDAADWRGALIGHALPGGIVTRDAFEELAGEILDRLKSLMQSPGLDGLWFDIHGAMCVEGLDDAEFELLARIRSVVGPEVIVSASMDLHGNVSRGLVHQTDLITCYRTAPHIDVSKTKQRACRNLVELLAKRSSTDSGKLRPIKAWIPVPILLPGEQTSTRLEPAKHIYSAVPVVETWKGVLDAAVWVGYAWADEPRNRAAIVATGWGGEVIKAAEHLAELFWDSRKAFAFVAPTGSFAECIDAALASAARPYFISDSGDNPTAGGSGDVTWGLTQLLARPEFKKKDGPTVIYASIPGPEAVRIAVEGGIGGIVTVTAGAEVDYVYADPITMTGRVHSIKQGDQHADIEVVLQVGSVYAILTRLRKPYHLERDFVDLGLFPRSAAIVIVKIGYLEPELYDMAADWMLGLTPGGVDQDLGRLGHHRIRRPMWPFDKTFEVRPDLSARIVPASNMPLPSLDI
ncbi:hypothetical protein BJ170DRAFT_618522 [Xylariales sp. AK1849]|nr:hypothetical protein BJ170DRAFT_618522 [Xylariales sp. AK1849]